MQETGASRNSGLYAVGIGLSIIGFGLIYLSFTLSRALVSIPEVIEIGRATEAEIAEYREVIAEALEEVEAVRLAIPEYLEQTQEIVRGTELEAAEYREVIAEVLEEVEAVRLAIPGYLDRAQELTETAQEAGQKAGEGAVSGVFTGFLKAPVSLVFGVGRTVLGNQDLSSEDRIIIRQAMTEVLENKDIGESVNWENPRSELSGTVTLLSESGSRKRPCKRLDISILRSGNSYLGGAFEVCRDRDGNWVVESE